MPGRPVNSFSDAVTDVRSNAARRIHQGPGSADRSTGNLNPNASNFSPGPLASQVSQLDKAGKGPSTNGGTSKELSSSQASPIGMEELTFDVNVLTKEVLKLRREKTAIEETLKNVSWTVTFRPSLDPSGCLHEQALHASASISTNAESESQNGPVVGEAKDGNADRETGSEASAATLTQENNTAPSAGVHNDCPLSNIQDPVLYDTCKQPLPIRSLEPLGAQKLSEIPKASQIETFSFDFLHEMLGGEEHSPGLYYTPPSKRQIQLPTHTWYALDTRFEPYLPGKPGAHGAKLTAFFNSNIDEDDDEGPCYKEVPVFVCASKWLGATNENLFIYYGSYSQSRWSDKLDYDRMIEAVPSSVKNYWAEQLTDPGRPKWVTEALMKHFWPQPPYEGTLPSPGDAEMSKVVRKDMDAYVKELKDWKKEAGMKVGMLKKENILQAFQNPDAGEEPGLRMWWEYLQCVDWDKSFYDALVKRKLLGMH